MTNESGHDEVYVQRYPGSGERHQVSGAGGAEPTWTQNGRELFFIVGSRPGVAKMMVVDVSLDAGFTAGKPRMLFEAPYAPSSPFRAYDVTPDGQRFLMAQTAAPPPAPALTHIGLVQNWTEELKRLVPTK